MDKVRADKWLWSVRIFKTRTKAADMCEKGNVKIDGHEIKASRHLKAGDKIEIRKGPFHLEFEVLQLTDKRMAAKLVPDFCKEITPSEEIEKMQMHALALKSMRQPGDGRPTKRERRALDEFLDWE